MLLLEMHVHLIHKQPVMLLINAASYLTSVLQRRAAAAGSPEHPVDAALIGRIQMYKQVRVQVAMPRRDHCGVLRLPCPSTRGVSNISTLSHVYYLGWCAPVACQVLDVRVFKSQADLRVIMGMLNDASPFDLLKAWAAFLVSATHKLSVYGRGGSVVSVSGAVVSVLVLPCRCTHRRVEGIRGIHPGFDGAVCGTRARYWTGAHLEAAGVYPCCCHASCGREVCIPSGGGRRHGCTPFKQWCA